MLKFIIMLLSISTWHLAQADPSQNPATKIVDEESSLSKSKALHQHLVLELERIFFDTQINSAEKIVQFTMCLKLAGVYNHGTLDALIHALTRNATYATIKIPPTTNLTGISHLEAFRKKLMHTSSHLKSRIVEIFNLSYPQYQRLEQLYHTKEIHDTDSLQRWLVAIELVAKNMGNHGDLAYVHAIAGARTIIRDKTLPPLFESLGTIAKSILASHNATEKILFKRSYAIANILCAVAQLRKGEQLTPEITHKLAMQIIDLVVACRFALNHDVAELLMECLVDLLAHAWHTNRQQQQPDDSLPQILQALHEAGEKLGNTGGIDHLIGLLEHVFSLSSTTTPGYAESSAATNAITTYLNAHGFVGGDTFVQQAVVGGLQELLPAVAHNLAVSNNELTSLLDAIHQDLVTPNFISEDAYKLLQDITWAARQDAAGVPLADDGTPQSAPESPGPITIPPVEPPADEPPMDKPYAPLPLPPSGPVEPPIEPPMDEPPAPQPLPIPAPEESPLSILPLEDVFRRAAQQVAATDLLDENTMPTRTIFKARASAKKAVIDAFQLGIAAIAAHLITWPQFTQLSNILLTDVSGAHGRQLIADVVAMQPIFVNAVTATQTLEQRTPIDLKKAQDDFKQALLQTQEACQQVTAVDFANTTARSFDVLAIVLNQIKDQIQAAAHRSAGTTSAASIKASALKIMDLSHTLHAVALELCETIE